jgi:hypothetical protein
MNGAIAHTTRGQYVPEWALLRHCLVLDEAKRPSRPARLRLEEALGPALAERLVSSLSLTRRS